MTYLELVQKAIRKSGAKLDQPTTIVGASGLTELFVEWVQDAWKEIQLEHLGWKWRISRDETTTLVIGTNEYAIPATLESIDKRTVTVYENADDESDVCYVPYNYWRGQYDKADPADNNRPTHFTITPDDNIGLYPPPDKAYTLRYDGRSRVEILDDTDDADTPTGIHSDYHDGIMWRAVMYYAAHFGDGNKAHEAQTRFRPYQKHFEERKLEDIIVDTTALYNRTA